MKIAVLSDNRAEGGSLEPEHGLPSIWKLRNSAVCLMWELLTGL